ncbi:MAG: type II secretion system protein [Capsulimonas sp.]|uniref:type II secretion system protein n=1 Tax=Capsulimonas sp. TaxID=2494211 RepID=UPI0032634427
MAMRRSAARQRGQWSLVGMLVAIAILMILAATIVPQIAAEHSKPGQAATPKERAYGSACSEYAAQMSQAVQMYKIDHNDRTPRDVSQLKKYGVTDEQIYAQGCSYQIDPDSGTVTDVGGGRANNAPPPSAEQLPQGFHPDGIGLPPGSPAPSSYAPSYTPSAAPPPSAAPAAGTTLPGGIRMPNIPTAGADM